MKTELHIITTSVGMLLMVRPTYPSKDTLKSIIAECERLKIVFANSFNYTTDALMLTAAMNMRYAGLVALANDLLHNAPKHNPFHKHALRELVALVAYLDEHYSGFLKPELALSDFERFKLQDKFTRKLITIRDLLLSKGISKVLIDKLVKSIEDLFNVNKHPVFKREDRQYLEAFMPDLFALAADQRNKDWNLRFRQLLIQWNFNNMGIYKVLEAEQQKQTSARRNYQQQHQYLFEQCLWLEQIQPKTTLAYNRQAADLKSLLMTQVKSLQIYIKEVVEMKQYEVQHKLALNLNVEELAIAFKYNFDDGIFAYAHKKEAAEEVSRHFKTKGTDDISYRSLIKFDKVRLNRAAVSISHRYQSIIDQIVKDFDIGYTG